MPKVNLVNFMQTRSNIGCIPQKYIGVNYEKSFFANTLKLWNNLPKDIQSKELFDFKIQIKQKNETT